MSVIGPSAFKVRWFVFVLPFIQCAGPDAMMLWRTREISRWGITGSAEMFESCLLFWPPLAVLPSHTSGEEDKAAQLCGLRTKPSLFSPCLWIFGFRAAQCFHSCQTANNAVFMWRICNKRRLLCILHAGGKPFRHNNFRQHPGQWASMNASERSH